MGSEMCIRDRGTVKYTEFFGNEDYNLMYDRDFLQAMVQYSF